MNLRRDRFRPRPRLIVLVFFAALLQALGGILTVGGKQKEELRRLGVGRCAVCAIEELMPGGFGPIPAFLRAAAPVFFHNRARWHYHAIYPVAFVAVLVTAVQGHRVTGREITELALSRSASIVQLAGLILREKFGYPIDAGIFAVVGD